MHKYSVYYDQLTKKIAVHVFANGRRNTELRTIIKERNYSKLSDAITAEADEQTLCANLERFFNTRGGNTFADDVATNISIISKS